MMGVFLGLFPAWVPSDELVVFWIVFVAAVLLMNRGRWWVLNVLAQDEPLLVGLGALLIALGLSGSAREYIPTFGQEVWLIVGAIVAFLGIIAWYSDGIDISNLL